MEAKFNFVSGSIEIYGDLDEVAVNFAHRLGFRNAWDDGKISHIRLTFGTTKNGVDAFSIFAARYKKVLTYHEKFPSYAKPLKLTRADLEKGLGQSKDRLTWDGDSAQLRMEVSTDNARNWAAWLTGEYDATHFRTFMYQTGWNYKNGAWFIKVQHSWVKLYWDKMKFPDFVKVDELVNIIIDQTLNHENKAEALFAKASVNFKKLADKPPTGCYPLFPHQAEWLRSIKKRNNILAFDMGLGKTLSALYWALAYEMTNEIEVVYIITPKSVRTSWLRNLEQSAFSEMVVQVCTWAAIPEPPLGQKYILIADESHYTQDPESQRTVRFCNFAKHSLATLMLSGTPSKNGTCRDIFIQLQVCGLPTAVNKAVFASRYGWKDEMKLRKLGDDVKDYIHYRHKSDTLNLPPKIRVSHEVELNPRYKKLYDQRYAEYMSTYNQRVQAGLVEGGVENLVELSGMRLAAALGKAEGVAELTKDIVDSGNQVAIFFDFREAVELTITHLSDYKVCELKASDSEKVRQQKIDDFRAGKCDVFLTTYKCGGVGVELTPCSYLILGDRPWTPGDAIQAEDRSHRIGQTGTLTVYWVYWDDPDKIEETVDSKIHLKQGNINYLLGSSVSLEAD